ncbi:MAG TPA: EAL domain-containing protein [Methylophilaceae bacterium]|nr:EAL domain-containing protein [Methylophilaceae bacterium]
MVSQIDPRSLLDSIYRSAVDFAIITFDKRGKVTTWNAGAEHITGFQAEEMIGEFADDMFTPEDRAAHVPSKEFLVALTTGRAADYRWHLRKNGTRFWADGVMTPILDERNIHIGFVKIMRDVTEQKMAEADMHKLVNFDVLTGLVNRFSFDLRLKELIAMARRSGQLLIMQSIDLDRFKEINDTLGHEAGDVLLKHVAQRMRQAVRDTDIIARLGGDEFIVLQPNMSSPEAGGELAGKLIETISRPYYIEGHEVMISCSIGIAICPDDADDPAQLMKRSDLALYRAKNESRGGFHYFTKGLDAAVHRKNQLLALLREAQQRKDFRLEYQPQVNCITGKPISVEALLRFNNPTLANQPLEEVIQLAVESGVMPDISIWVLQQACQQLRQWQAMGLDELKISVNVCTRDLMNVRIPQLIENILQETGVDAVDLEIELTENHALQLGDPGFQNMDQLRQRGITLVLDDFGQGYSALNCLRKLPINKVKLDQLFIRDIPHDEPSCTMVESLIRVANALNLEVVAEGVETPEQADFLCSCKCSAMQGFFYSPARPADEIGKWLMNGRKTLQYAQHGNKQHSN